MTSNEKRTTDEAAVLLHDVKAYRELYRNARRGKDEAERAYREAELDPSPEYGTRLILDPPAFLAQTVRAMNEDDSYSYETLPPLYQGKFFIVSTANVNEYQARFFGPLPHDEMRKIFREFDRQHDDPKTVRLFRSNFAYEAGEPTCTGLRAAFSVDWLKETEGGTT